ncbi:hypothetical protein E2C01_021594 [Portunus trituberculatus]|uniref:Uncharacterized protein n=1 Tax=Portunus trituberculatus TaxID=210409 RepID=A0A5B7E344_PORTR|nr:hypothetical protein [Portunus trituberculatus]
MVEGQWQQATGVSDGSGDSSGSEGRGTSGLVGDGVPELLPFIPLREPNMDIVIESTAPERTTTHAELGKRTWVPELRSEILLPNLGNVILLALRIGILLPELGDEILHQELGTENLLQKHKKGKSQ